MESSVHSGPVQPPTGTDTAGLSVKGLYLVFTDPNGFFTKLKERHSVLVPYLVYGVLTFAMFFLMKDLMGPIILEETQRQYADNPQMSEAMRNVTPEMFELNFMLFGGVSYLLMPLVAAALGFFVGSFIFAGKARFGQVLSVMLYGAIIYMTGNVLSSLIARVTDNAFFSFTPAVLAADRGFNSPLFVLLSKINPFLIWELIVIGIGLAIFYGFPRNKGYWVSVLSMGLLPVIQVVWTAIASLMI